MPNREMFQMKPVYLTEACILFHVQHFCTTSSSFRESVKSELNLYEIEVNS
jgi:hypothetical protein